MRIAILGDLHLIPPMHPYSRYRALRQPIFGSPAAVARALRWLDGLGLDAVISLGDLVDWHDEASLAFAVETMSTLRCAWFVTPGNHDYQVPRGGPESSSYDNHGADVHRNDCLARWRAHGVELRTRCIDIDGWNLLLVDSARSYTSDEDLAWLRARGGPRSLLLTHVPIDEPAIRALIASTDPWRDMAVYTQARSPELHDIAIRDRITHVFTGHLHFAGEVRVGRTMFHLTDASFARVEATATATIVEGDASGLHVRTLRAPA